MLDSSFTVQNVTDNDIIEAFSLASSETLYNPLGGSKVVKIGATMEEAQNQRIARSLVDPKIVYVPEVYRFFIHQNRGHIVMEYVKGQTF